jgi:ABC-type branched-subunit amino acid transport system ATPase component
MILPGDDNAGGSLEVRQLGVHFEGLRALDSVDLTLRRGEILGLIGPNGAGKTTLVNAITGFQKPSAGRICLDGRDVTSAKAHQLCRLGLARTFQGARLFLELSVAENIELGGLGAGLSRRTARAMARGLMSRFGVEDAASTLAGWLPHGSERRVAILRALACSPRYLLLDEPAAGLNEDESDELVTVIGDIRREFECGILVIEHDMRLIMRLCDRIHVLDYGKTIACGPPGDIQRDPVVIAAYLGEKREFGDACS